MPDKLPVAKKGISADWFLRGALTRIGDSFDRFTGRRWVPSSSLAASELIERIKKLLDSEAREVPGKGTVVPHNIKLKMQWDKFSNDAEASIDALRNELLAAAVDHINDSLYYTYAPVSMEVKPDYFIEGVKLYVSFDKFTDEESDAEENVTVPDINVSQAISSTPNLGPLPSSDAAYFARFEIHSNRKEIRLDFPVGQQRRVGRTSANDLILDDASVSKIHASLVADKNGSLSVADTGSTNGTFINDQRIAYGKAIRLADGDKVRFGMIEITFEHIPRPEALESQKTSSLDDVSIATEPITEPGGDGSPDIFKTKS